MSLLQLESLSVEIAGIEICRQLNLTIEAGSSWVLLGRNGAGKSTLIHTLAALRSPTAGNIKLAGQAIDEWDRRQRAQQLALLLQESGDPFPSTVLETVLIGRHPHLGRWQWEGEEDIEIARRALQQVSMGEFESRMVDTLSGGERQRVAIAALIAQQPQLMLLDEPTNHLDLHHQVTLLEMLRATSCNHDGALVTVLHDVNLALRFCDHALLLFPDGSHQHGRFDEVVNTESLGRLYDHPVVELKGDQRRCFLPD